MLEHFLGEPPGSLHRPVAAEGIDDNDLVGPADTPEAAGYVAFLVKRDRDDGERFH